MIPPDSRVEFQKGSTGTAIGSHNTINIYQNGEIRFVEVVRLFGPIDEIRILANYWKNLHKDLQSISSDLTLVHSLLAAKDLDAALTHWQKCSDCIEVFVISHPGDFPQRMTDQDSAVMCKVKEWLATLGVRRSKLDDLFGQFEEFPIFSTLHELEKLSGKILTLLDIRLQQVIGALDVAVSDARQHLTEPPDST